MPFLEFIYHDIVLSVVLSFLLAGGALLPTDEFKKFKAAKACWWLLALYLCGRVLMWSVLTSEKLQIRAFGVFLAFGAIGVVCSEMVRLVDGRETRFSATEQEPPKPVPPVQQTSQGNNSPNTAIIGNNNVVTNSINSSDPKVLAKLDAISKLIREQQGDLATPDKLLKKYPLGYVVFDIDEQRSVFPYATKSLLDHWGFDWSTVKLTEDGQENHIWLTMPNMIDKEHRNTIQSLQIGGLKRLGTFGGFKAIVATPNFSIKAEILAIKRDGIVFLIGFSPPD